MTATLEDRLAAALRTQAGRLAHPSPELGDAVIRRGRRVRRRRRVGALAGLAALVAGMAVISSPLGLDKRGLPDQTYAPPSDVATVTVDSSTWTEADGAFIPYALGSMVVDRYDEHRFYYDTLIITSVYKLGDATYLTAAAGEDGTTLFLDDPTDSEPTALVQSGIGEPALSSDGRRVAWVAFGGFGSVEAADDRWVVLYDLVTGLTTDGPPLPQVDLAVAGFRDGRVVLTSAGEGQVREWDPATDRLTDIDVAGHVVDVRDDLALMTIDGCAVAVDGAWSQLWRDCDLQVAPGAIAPRGDQIVARASDDRLVFVDSRTGRRTTAISGVEVLPDVWSQRALRWEGDGRVVFIAATAGEPPRLARCTPSAALCAWAGPPPPYDRAGQPVGLVLGHQAPDPRRAD